MLCATVTTQVCCINPSPGGEISSQKDALALKYGAKIKSELNEDRIFVKLGLFKDSFRLTQRRHALPRIGAPLTRRCRAKTPILISSHNWDRRGNAAAGAAFSPGPNDFSGSGTRPVPPQHLEDQTPPVKKHSSSCVIRITTRRTPKANPAPIILRRTLSKAVEATGVVGLTVQHLLNASSTPLICEKERVATVAPAFMDHRRVQDLMNGRKKSTHVEWLGRTKGPSLLKSERYIHTAMSKNGFRLVVTMHPQIALYIHHTLALNIVFTFKRIEGRMNEWGVAGMSDHFKSLNSQDMIKRFQHSVITDNDFGLNSFNPTGEFLNFLNDEFLSHLEMDTVGSYSVADLPDAGVFVPHR
ncbi:hypothetical protein K438DRAFT_1756019 [Mycena galopus ATCC 62051]|nr:hypothetical protein K438DRAFT_1756019 [Mycena galopus ATCC 62051]